MRAVRFATFGGPETLSIDLVATPDIGPGDVLVATAYAALQPFDRRVRSGDLPLPAGTSLPVITGNEFSGHVAAIGPAVTGFAIGDRVAGRRTFGAVADYVAAPAADLARVPDTLDLAAAATLSGTAQTADAALESLGLSAGDTLLVLGAAGGVGSFALPLARALGAMVLGTGSAESLGHIADLGAAPIAATENLAEAVARLAPDSVSAILDCVGGAALSDALKLAVPRERICSIAEMGAAAKLGLQPLRGVRDGKRLAKLIGLAADGALPVTIRAVYPMSETGAAHAALDTGHGRGKIVIEIAPQPASAQPE